MTLQPARVPRQLTLSICQARFWKLTVLSRLTVRSNWSGEDQVEVAARAGGEGGAALRRRHLEAAVELGHVVLAQKAVGFRKGADPVQPELLRQPSLPGPEVAFRAAPRLGRVSRNHLHAQIAQRTAHLGQTMRVHLAASLRCQPEMTASIRVQGAEQPLALDDFSQRGHHWNRRFFFHQLGVIDFAGGVVQNHDQVIQRSS